MTDADLREFADHVETMIERGRVPNFAFWPDRTILYVGNVDRTCPPRIEVDGPFEASALVAARQGAELAQGLPPQDLRRPARACSHCGSFTCYGPTCRDETP